jgi:predicted negative regulator of RcsB-dependent stress response
MATYDLEQQEQIENAKHFWQKYGNLITWTLVIAMAGYAAWTGWLYWQNDQAVKASVLFEELERAALQSDADKATRVFTDLKDKHPGTTYAAQGALLAAQALAGAGKEEPARAALQWLTEKGKNPDLVAVGRLRLAGLLLDAKQYDAALKQLDTEVPEEYAALAQDRRGDIYMAQGKKPEALKAYQAAWKGLDAKVEYRRFVEGKLTALGEPPAPSEVQAATAAAAASAP